MPVITVTGSSCKINATHNEMYDKQPLKNKRPLKNMRGSRSKQPLQNIHRGSAGSKHAP